MASRLLRAPPDRAVWVRGTARDIVLCSWTRHCTLTVPLSGYAGVQMGTGGFNVGDNPGGNRNIPSRFMLQKPG